MPITTLKILCVCLLLLNQKTALPTSSQLEMIEEVKEHNNEPDRSLHTIHENTLNHLPKANDIGFKDYFERLFKAWNMGDLADHYQYGLAGLNPSCSYSREAFLNTPIGKYTEAVYPHFGAKEWQANQELGTQFIIRLLVDHLGFDVFKQANHWCKELSLETAKLEAQEKLAKKCHKKAIELENIRRQTALKINESQLKLLSIQAKQFWELLHTLGRSIKQWTHSKQTWLLFTLLASLFILIVFSITAIKSLFAKQPKIIKETNIRWGITSLFWRSNSIDDRSEDICLDPGLKEALDLYIQCLIEARKSKGTIPAGGAAFHGEPGTGKTLMLKEIARKVDCAYIIIDGSRLLQFPEAEGIAQINKLLELLKTHKEFILLGIDESDPLLHHREDGGSNTNILTPLLAAIEKPYNKNFAIIYLTNLPDTLDTAAIERVPFGNIFEFPLPTNEVAKKTCKKYLIKFSSSFHLPLELTEHDIACEMAHVGLSHRQIEAALQRMFILAQVQKLKKITPSELKEAFSAARNAAI